MTQVKAKLTVVLMADETVVAEREDPVLWQRVLMAINGSGTSPEVQAVGRGGQHGTSALFGGMNESLPHQDGDAISKFALAIRTPVDVVIGACAPSMEGPFLHLDRHCWEEMKRQLPPRGPGAISAIGLAATLLCLWYKAADLGSPTQAQAQAVLGTIDISDHNPSRGLKAADWLQTRPGGVVLLNPARTSRALNVARSFCTKTWSVESSIESRPRTADGISVTAEPLL